jgi:hypothetical protein
VAPGEEVRRLGDIAIVTHCVAEIAPVEAAWQRCLDYCTVARGEVSADMCEVWQTPAAAGQRWCLMQPASGEPVYLRFVETGAHGGHTPPATWGWSATEILVQDPDGLAARLEGSPFQRIGGPGNLYPWQRAPRAMQMHGPAGELLYLTRILPNSSRYGMKGARCDVDRVFIVTVGGPSLSALHEFYARQLGQRIIERAAIINAILAHDCSVPSSTRFASSIVRIPGRRFLIELDELPHTVGPRPRPAGQLPPGMSMVSFHTAGLAGLPLRAPPARVAAPPYDGRRAAVIIGPAGEWVELLETAST